MTPAEFTKVFKHGFQVVPVTNDYPHVDPFPLHGVSMNADGSLQLDLGGRERRVVVESTGPKKWMVDAEVWGKAALRPLTAEQHERFWPKKDSGGSNAVSGEAEQSG